MHTNTISIRVDRDSVHQGDDLDSHATTVEMPSGITVGELLRHLREIRFLPGIAGGEATWLVDACGTCIGVIAQQWREPELTIDSNKPVSALSEHPAFYFRYWCQANPDQVFACVLAGKELPNKYR